MGQWLAKLKANPEKGDYPPVTQVTEAKEPPPFVTSVTPTIRRFGNFRFIESLADLTDQEHRLVLWLAARGLVYPFQAAAYMNLPIDKLEGLLAVLDNNRYLVNDGGMIALNVYAKQKLGLTNHRSY